MEAVKVPLGGVGAPEIRVYRKRWVILALFLLELLFNAVPWMQYTVLADVATVYYGVSNTEVEWTALVYNLTAMVLVIPAAFVLDKYGLRPSMLVGAVLNAAGLWLRVVGVWPDCFWAVLAGHALVSVATNFFVSAPPRLAAVWFPADEVSSAVGASIIGQMGGVSLGCLLAPLTARQTWTPDENFRGFLVLNLTLAILATVLLVAVFFLFDQAPAHPPSPAQAAAQAAGKDAPEEKGSYFKSLLRICKNGGFLLLLLSFNIIISVYVAITTVLNRDITQFFPDRAAETGYLATLLCVTGIVATFGFGIALDKTKKFKELSGICYFGGLASIALFSGTISTCSMEVVYLVAAIVGVFMTSYFVPAFEWGVELTYPEPEGNPTSLLNWLMQFTSLVTTLTYSHMFSVWGPHVAHGFLVALMAIGFVAQLCIPKRYLRREAELALAKAAEAAGPAGQPLL
ncbi:feline leukemia virus subgroup C receptor-related protein 1 [Frankliniella occidentalis]|uniref:Feline leukemia virus subgroup C receptor-related protein 1 n=1 Tax=Frankliniella occidentalis TaxID=133901 RepID=A0A6J1T3C6_FRAOC|nr:feline leukemia virus subgroup C receptor-related protein 1 [Frankliniella occidentalis]XP_026287462.1 feline leukemia virus subgroup C receptor-related protein 1 [Frankliniella occidentalis]